MSDDEQPKKKKQSAKHVYAENHHDVFTRGKPVIDSQVKSGWAMAQLRKLCDSEKALIFGEEGTAVIVALVQVL